MCLMGVDTPAVQPWDAKALYLRERSFSKNGFLPVPHQEAGEASSKFFLLFFGKGGVSNYLI